MSLIYNGTTIDKIIYNGTELDKLVYNGVTVFTSGIDVSVLAQFVYTGDSCVFSGKFSISESASVESSDPITCYVKTSKSTSTNSTTISSDDISNLANLTFITPTSGTITFEAWCVYKGVTSPKVSVTVAYNAYGYVIDTIITV